MSIQAQLMMIAWIPIVLYLFSRFKPQKAVIISFIFGWLFLPQNAGFTLPGLPDFERMSATCYGVLLGTLLFDGERFTKFRPSWFDLPMLIWCICPFFSSVTNGLGAYDGISNIFTHLVQYGLPYFLGRLYLKNLVAFRQLAIAMFIGGLIYMPLCLFEARFSPQLHRLVYGYHGIRQFAQGVRYGGFRPTVFMKHGLSVGMWMMAATLIGIWLWQSGVLKKIMNISIKWWLLALLITFILVKATGAYLYLAFGLFILFVAQKFRTAIPLMALIILLFSYVSFNAMGVINRESLQPIVEFAASIEEERAASLAFRWDNEEVLTEKARQQFLFGWGGWGRNRVYEENSQGELVDTTVADSLWIIVFGQMGFVGLIALYTTTLAPILLLTFFKYPSKYWFHPQIASVIVLSVVLVLFMIDCTLNAQPNPVFIFINGGLVSLVASRHRVPSQSRSSQRYRLMQLRRRLADRSRPTQG